MPKTAIFVKHITDWGDGHDVRLYRVSQPYQVADGGWYTFVIVAAMTHSFLGSETLVYPANNDGTMGSMDPLEVVKIWDHQMALKKAGYEIEQ